MSLELPPLVRCDVFLVFFCLSEGPSGSPFAVSFNPFLEGEILDCLAHSLVI